MDWICPNDNRMLSHQLQKYHGEITAEVTISDIVSYVTTLDLHGALPSLAVPLATKQVLPFNKVCSTVPFSL